MGDHAHADINNIEIYHRGSLAIDAGRYDDDWTDGMINSRDSMLIRKSQFFNYYRRTIAHNTILVKDPDEYISQNLYNDGGQLNLLRPNGYNSYRNVPEDYDQGNFPSEEGIAQYDWVNKYHTWETGEITTYTANKTFTYFSGDGTKAYSANKLDRFVRKVVFIQPNIFVILDEVVVKNPSFKKTWLLHSINKPEIKKKVYKIKHEKGVLLGKSILPKSAKLTKIGGKGMECSVDGINFPFGLNSHFDPTALHFGEEAGAWRIEISPLKPAISDYFLNIFKVGATKDQFDIKYKLVKNDQNNVEILIEEKNMSYKLNLSKSNDFFELQMLIDGSISQQFKVNQGQITDEE
jgi:heparin/heparan-sulfate lyase